MISENKIKHMLGVARKCRTLAESKGLPDDECDAMFIMGLLHDIGCEDEFNLSNGKRSEEMIRNFEKYLDNCCSAIACYGFTLKDWSIFDEILSKADMAVNYRGIDIDADD